ncbi:GNAT family N-acetyltransferase [Meiothermus sp. Pnk-1]|uniref:GNAT family N-acetyltransferase n=1 Tax=Meiothermus sp. Pnk-1 TaxID=873128 RepID=UPI000D7CE707|nr:GNAT family N-acetyltransferase [Meiothermus sp. Pnk-1]PZA06093.1 GNAT family N-acetyltransferase [Meiothermus sp. Pnk-1]
MWTISRLGAEEARAVLPELAEVLRDCVDGGASVSFLPPLAWAEAWRFWERMLSGLAEGQRILLTAQQGGQVVGTVMLELSSAPNSLHRAEVQKLLVHRKARRQGIAEALMRAVEKAALEAGRTLLYLDTCKGCAAETLYRKLGWVEVGIIPRFAKQPRGFCDTVIFYKHPTSYVIRKTPDAKREKNAKRGGRSPTPSTGGEGSVSGRAMPVHPG